MSSTVNVAAGRTNPNLAIVAVGAGRLVNLYNHAGDIDLLVDVQGFYTPEFGAVFTPLTPRRIFDTRDGTGTYGGRISPVEQQENRGVEPGAVVPEEAIGAVVNITGIDPTAGTFVTAWANTNIYGPPTSNLNLVQGQTAANHAVVTISGDVRWQRFYLYNNTGNTHVAVDMAGYFSMPAAPCSHDCAYVWGSNIGYLGNGTRTSTSLPAPLHGLSGVVSVASRTAALADGSVWVWGANSSYNVGDDWSPDVVIPFPVRVPGFTGAAAVADTDGAEFSPAHYALRSDGTVWSWGGSAHGALGTGGVTPPGGKPLRVSGLTGVTAIAGGAATGYALRSDGTVWAWGWNDQGQLGSGSAASESTVPVRVTGLTGVVAIAAGGSNAYAITADGDLWTWGTNQKGTLGIGTTGGYSRIPVRVPGLAGVIAVDGDGQNSYAVRDDGTVWSWGAGDWAGLGNGTNCFDCVTNVPGHVDGISDAVDVVSHYRGAQVLNSAGRIWVWGWNQDGDLGIPPSSVPATRPILNPNLNGVTALGDGGQALIPTP
jgi:alpha-tubulin suppressor-like RCC1 family protein